MAILRTALGLAWAAAVVTALVLLVQGLSAGVSFENTEEALAEAQHGQRLIGVACLLLVAMIALCVVRSWPSWVAVGLALPVVLCGGLTAVASGSLFPQLSVVLAFPGAAAAGVGGLVLLARGR